MTISLTLGMEDGTTDSSIYWMGYFGVFAEPHGTVAPGSLMGPLSGGPVPAGTQITLTYLTAAPVTAMLNVDTSTQPIPQPVNSVPADGYVFSILLHVQ